MPTYRVYSVENRDYGQVTFNGREVKSYRCCPSEGWADCFVNESGVPLSMNEPPVYDNTGRDVRKDRVYGIVEFESWGECPWPV